MSLNADEHRFLFEVARQTLAHSAQYGEAALTPLVTKMQAQLAELPPRLVALGAAFITLESGPNCELRGCTGTLHARHPLILEIIYSTHGTALRDPRFDPVRPEEVPQICIEISELTPSQPLDFDGPDDLLQKLTPGHDGVTLYIGQRRATFLPQVWQKIPEPVAFLGALCHKMGLPPTAWRSETSRVETYRAMKWRQDDPPPTSP